MKSIYIVYNTLLYIHLLFNTALTFINKELFP